MNFTYIENMSEEELTEFISSQWEDNLLTLLLNIQKKSKYSCIEERTAKLVSKITGMPMARLYEVLTFYEMLTPNRRGSITLSVCDSTPCHYVNNKKVIDVIKQELGIGVGETTSDGMFSLKYVPCMGMCQIGPIMCAKEVVYGNLTEEKIKKLIHNLRCEEEKKQKNGKD